jgi:hypothetical protein
VAGSWYPRWTWASPRSRLPSDGAARGHAHLRLPTARAPVEVSTCTFDAGFHATGPTPPLGPTRYSFRLAASVSQGVRQTTARGDHRESAFTRERARSRAEYRAPRGGRRWAMPGE